MTEDNYNNNSIDKLEGAERIRTRPASMLGSDGLAGARHGVIEILGNAIDEHTSGYGSKIIFQYLKDGSVVIRDYGRGVPMGWNEDKKDWNWNLIFNELYAGGKYNTYQKELADFDTHNKWDRFDPQDFNYLFSIGLNGLGSASTQYTSAFFEVKSYRDGKESYMKFEHGYAVLDKLQVTDTDEPNGTYIHWKPDDKVFTDIDLGSQFIMDLAKSTAYVSQLEVHFKDENIGLEKVIEAGTINNFLESDYGVAEDDILSTYKLTHGHTHVAGSDFIYVLSTQLAFAVVDEGAKVTAFHNAVKMVGREDVSAHHLGVRDALEEFFKRVNREKGTRIKYNDYKDKIAVVINSYSNTASYANQTKDLVDDEFIRLGVSYSLGHLIDLEYSKGNIKLTSMIDSIIEELRIREEVEEQRRQARQASKIINKQKKRKKIEKFIPSKYYVKHRVAGSQLLIVEGDSAKGSVKNARNNESQAILPLKGKILNVMKATVDKILANKEVSDIIALVGGGMDLPEIGQSFDINKVKFEEVLICTDADEDGYQIRVLAFLVFLRFMPEMIRQGRLYIAESPLFDMQYTTGSRYALNMEERDAMIKKYGMPAHIERFKGLGQVNSDILAKTTLDPEYTKRKNLVQIKFDTEDPTIYAMIDTLFGTDEVKGRKQLILQSLGRDVADAINDNDKLFADMSTMEETQDDMDVQTIEV